MLNRIGDMGKLRHSRLLGWVMDAWGSVCGFFT